MNVIFHVGLHKTGTTFLQKEVFPNIKGINYNIYNPNLEYSLKKNETYLFSREGFSGLPLASVNLNALDRDLIAYGISKKFPKAKIILGMRGKKGWLKSLYNLYVKGGGYLSYDDWFEKIDKRYLDFDGYIDLLNELFDEVFIYKLEDLKNTNKKCVKSICDFIGCEVPKYRNQTHNKSWKSWKMCVGKVRGFFIRNSRIFLDEI